VETKWGAKTALKTALATGAAAALMVGAGLREAGAEPVVSSWYGPGFEGALTASGEPFDPNGHTAAHKTLPFGTKLLVTYEGRQVIVEVTDRGPFVEGRDLDLSQAAAEHIGLTGAGYDVVDVQVLSY
jgi:rare lipoprotein A